MGLEASYTQSIISQGAKIDSQGRLFNVNGAQFTGIAPSGEIAENIPGLVLDFTGPSGNQRLALQITDGQAWYDLELHALGLILDEEGIDKVQDVIQEQAKRVRETHAIPVSRREVPQSEYKYEEDPNGQSDA